LLGREAVPVSGAVASIVILLVAVWPTLSRAADDTFAIRVAFFGFHLINTSLEPTTADETRRLRMLDAAFMERLQRSGRFRIVPIPPGMQSEIEASAEIADCNGCERSFATRLGAEMACWGAVQKVSNLILNINAYIENAATGKMQFAKSVDIRGNTDESWRRGLDYLFREQLIGPESGSKD
jgi:hypothetical protein